MENVDIKTIIYIVIAVIWFLYSSFNKSKKEARKQTAQPPPLSEDEIKEIFQKNIEEPKYSTEAGRKLKGFSVIDENKVKKKVAKTPTTKSTSFSEDELHSSGENNLQNILAGVDPEDMVIYSEILKRPEY
ncbi:MAG: hypothetical protein H0X62_01050 [Bacteroidetes bacterium]|nr:hypothetical protein [Bacteroidota bacterium]